MITEPQIFFIHKDTKKIIDFLPYPYEGGITPNHGEQYYIVISDIHGDIGDDWSAVIDTQLERLRALHPDVVTKYVDEDGEEHESVEYGKYSYLGRCNEPWERVDYADL